MKKIELIGIEGLPIIKQGDNIENLILKNGPRLKNGDVIVIAQKIISKTEGKLINLLSITPSQQAIELANKTGRDSAFCQVIIDECDEIIEIKGKVIVTRLKNGMICTSSGIDKSNIEKGGENVILLPDDSDKTAREIKKKLEEKTNSQIAVIINDSLGSPDRDGSIGKAIGIAGISGIKRSKGKDLHNNPASVGINIVDEIAGAASLLMGQSDEGIPIVIVRGCEYNVDKNSGIRDILF